MTRLFVALDLPPGITAELARRQPPPLAGIALIKAAQMHITLNFIGEAPMEPVIAMLRLIRARAFSLKVSGLGKFRHKSGGATLWAGVDFNEALLELHADIGIVLGAAGFQAESRGYQPHVTLAKYQPEVSAQYIADFIEKSAPLVLPDVAVYGFALYSSSTDNEGTKYKVEQWFPLRGINANAIPPDALKNAMAGSQRPLH